MYRINKGGHDGCGKFLFALALVVLFSGLATLRAMAMGN